MIAPSRFRTYAAAVALALTIVSTAQAKYSGGMGEPNDPYQIATAADLIALGETPADYDKHFILTADIDLDPNLPGRKVFDKAVIAPDTNDATTWFEGAVFTGTFNGKGRTISHLTIVGAGSLGLFGQLGSLTDKAEVSDLTLLDAFISGSGDCVGGLAGSNSYGTVTDCHVTVTVTALGGQSLLVGGLLGANYGDVTRCHSDGTVAGAGTHVGGLVGQNGTPGRMGRGGRVGRIVEAYSTADVRGRYFVGGLVGSNAYGNVSNCCSTGPVDGDEYIGGLVGQNAADVTDCYSTDTISGVRYVGGLVAHNADTVVRCYCIGSVIGTEDAGGLAGANTGTVTACFWDIQMSGLTSSAGGIGRTTAEMQTSGTFRAWGVCGPFWTISEGQDYPRLAWEDAPGETIVVQSYSGGTGTAQDPYLIYTSEDLNAIGLSSCHADKHFRLMADLDLLDFDGKDGRPVFNMIGPGQMHRTQLGSYFVGTAFSGVFDGGGHTISHLTLTGESYLGLFGYLSSGAEIRDLSVVDVNVTGSGSYIGGLAGYNGGRLVRCHSAGVVGGNAVVGGLVGENNGAVTACFSAVSPTAQGDYAYSVGGLAGTNSGTIRACYSTGAVDGVGNVGGLVGNNDGDVARCYSTGQVKGDSAVGGLVGSSYSNVALHSVWDVETSGISVSAGGVGLTTAEMMDPCMLGLNGFANDSNWVLDAGQDYPRLAWEGLADATIPEPNVDWLECHGTAEAPYRIDTADQLIPAGQSKPVVGQAFRPRERYRSGVEPSRRGRSRTGGRSVILRRLRWGRPCDLQSDDPWRQQSGIVRRDCRPQQRDPQPGIDRS